MLATGQRAHAASLASALGRTLLGSVHGLRALEGLEVLRLSRNLVQHDLTLLPRGSMPRKATHLKGGPTPHDLCPQTATDLAHVSQKQVVSVHFEAISILELEKEPLEPHVEVHMGQPPLLQGIKFQFFAKPQLERRLRDNITKVRQQQLISSGRIGSKSPLTPQLLHLQLPAIATHAVLLQGVPHENNFLAHIHATAVVRIRKLCITNFQELANLRVAVLQQREIQRVLQIGNDVLRFVDGVVATTGPAAASERPRKGVDRLGLLGQGGDQVVAIPALDRITAMDRMRPSTVRDLIPRRPWITRKPLTLRSGAENTCRGSRGS